MDWRKALVALLGLMTAALAHAQATQWPNRPITLVVPFAAGGPTDMLARSLAQSMTRTLGQLVSVENKLGAGGTTGAGYVAKARPDGYTFLIHHNGMATAPTLYRKLGFDPLKDYEYVGQTFDVPMLLVTRRDIPANSLTDLVAWLKASNGSATIATAGLGAASQLCGLLLQRSLGLKLSEVPFQGTSHALHALQSGQVDVLCDQSTNTLGAIKSGAVKFFGVAGRGRSKVLPEAPTLKEQGLNDVEVVVWHGIYAPRGTPKAVVEKMNGAVMAAVRDPLVLRRLTSLGAEFTDMDRMSPDGLQEWLKLEIDKWAPALRDQGKYAN